MWPFSKKEEVVAVAEQVAACIPPEVQQKHEVEVPPFGTQVAGLTRFGKTWLRMEEIAWIDFDTADECAAECGFKNSNQVNHFSDEDAAALQKYLESFEEIRESVDD